MRRFFPAFSYIFHPLFVSLYAVMCFLVISPSVFESVTIYLSLAQIIILTLFIPGAFFLFLRLLGFVDSVMADNPNQRKIPLAIQAVLIVLLILECEIVMRSPELNFFFKGVLISTILAFLLLFLKLKISLHLMGLGGLLYFVLFISYYNQENSLTLIAFLIAVTGLTATSRLHMRAHNYKELIAGYVVGVLPQMLLSSVLL